jgi:AbiTii-like protein
MRQSISAIDELVKGSAGSGSLQINASNLILMLQGKVYADYACNAVTGIVTRAQLVALQHAVRTRVLELTIGLEKSIPAAASIVLAGSTSAVQVNSEKVTQITNQVIYGNVTSIASTGAGATFNLAIQQGDQNSLVEALVQSGIPETDAAEFGQLVASEKPDRKDEPFGAKARMWLGENLKKATSGTWKMGVSVATEVLKQAALKYYGL